MSTTRFFEEKKPDLHLEQRIVVKVWKTTQLEIFMDEHGHKMNFLVGHVSFTQGNTHRTLWSIESEGSRYMSDKIRAELYSKFEKKCREKNININEIIYGNNLELPHPDFIKCFYTSSESHFNYRWQEFKNDITRTSRHEYGTDKWFGWLCHENKSFEQAFIHIDTLGQGCPTIALKMLVDSSSFHDPFMSEFKKISNAPFLSEKASYDELISALHQFSKQEARQYPKIRSTAFEYEGENVTSEKNRHCVIL